MLTLGSSKCKHKYRGPRGEGRSLPADIVSGPGFGSPVTSTAISSLESATDGGISDAAKYTKYIVMPRIRTKANAKVDLRSRPPLRFQHISLMMAGESSTSTLENTLYNSFRRCVEDCEKHHPICMRHRSSGYVRPNYLLDCYTRRVVRTDGSEQYACLSYVSGNRVTAEPKFRFVPKTIEDAIFVVKRLRLRYLWIDQYCTNNSDGIPRSQDTENKEDIFMGAFVTLVTRLRTNFGHLWLEKGSVARMSHASRWHRRAWTFQESICTRRMLVLEDGIWFVCKREVELIAELENEFGVNTDDETPRPHALFD